MDDLTFIPKPWGQEVILENKGGYIMKKIMINSMSRLSLQYHEYKKETIYVLEGKLILTTGENKDNLKIRVLIPGESATINPKCIHRFSALSEPVALLECSTDYPTDIVRIEDDYGR